MKTNPCTNSMSNKIFGHSPKFPTALPESWQLSQVTNITFLLAKGDIIAKERQLMVFCSTDVVDFSVKYTYKDKRKGLTVIQQNITAIKTTES